VAAGQGGVQGGLVMDTAARRAHENGARLHGRKGSGVHEPQRGGIARAVQGDDVSALQQFVEADGLGPARRQAGCVVGRVAADHLHAEGPAQGRDAAAGLAHAHQAQGAAAQLVAHHVLPAEAPGGGVQQAVGFVDAAQHGQHQADGHLGHRIRVAARLVHHGHAGARAGLDVDGVAARAAGGHGQQIGAASASRSAVANQWRGSSSLADVIW